MTKGAVPIPDRRPGLQPDYAAILPWGSATPTYAECAAGCGAARIVYSGGTVKRYECSCEVERTVMVPA